MLLALIGDCHIDQSNGSIHYQNNFKKFCDNVLLPTLKSKNIKTVLQTGDLFHNRKTVNTKSLDSSKECFFDKLQQNKIDLHLIIGNHDIHYKESLLINTPELVLAEYQNITIYKNPTTVNFNGVTIDFLSWICDENRQKTLEYINKSKSDYCFAHLELVGFKMSKTYVAEHGDDPNIFSRYTQVWSGHYHQKSLNGNVLYLGNPTQDTWECVDEVKGFHIFDTETREMEFIENPYNLFERIEYDNTSSLQSKNITEKYVKLIINQCDDNKKLEKYIAELWAQNPHDIKVIDNIIANDKVNSDITLEELDSGSFKLVPFLTGYTIKNSPDLTVNQQELVDATYMKVFNMNKDTN